MLSHSWDLQNFRRSLQPTARIFPQKCSCGKFESNFIWVINLHDEIKFSLKRIKYLFFKSFTLCIQCYLKRCRTADDNYETFRSNVVFKYGFVSCGNCSNRWTESWNPKRFSRPLSTTTNYNYLSPLERSETAKSVTKNPFHWTRPTKTNRAIEPFRAGQFGGLWGLKRKTVLGVELI